MTDDYYLALAANVLAACRRYQPDFFRPSPELVESWATALATRPMPVEVYPEAVNLFYAQATGGARPTVGDILHSCRVVMARWDSDPRRRPLLRKYRAEAEAERDRQIREGVFGELRGYQPPELEPPRGAGEPLPGVYVMVLSTPCRVCGAGKGDFCVRDGRVMRVPHVARMRG